MTVRGQTGHAVATRPLVLRDAYGQGVKTLITTSDSHLDGCREVQMRLIVGCVSAASFRSNRPVT